jgi:hypothetical protein
MRRTATRAADVLPKELILQIQEHLPEGGKLSIPCQGCSQRFLLSDDERLTQDLEITMKSLKLVSARELAEDYEVSITGVRKIIDRTLAAMKGAVGGPPPAFEPTKTLDKKKADQQEDE